MKARGQDRQVHAALEDVALIDAKGITACYKGSLSDWHDRVRRGDAPRPVIQRPRFTRWALADVRAWLEKQQTQQTPEATAAVVQQARKASAAARAKAATLKGAEGATDARA